MTRDNKIDFNQLQAIVTGATSQIGHFLLPKLLYLGCSVTAISRHPPTHDHLIHWQNHDLYVDGLTINSPTILFHIAPLPTLTAILAKLPQDTPLLHVIAFSSTSRLTKIHSSEPQERNIAKQLAQAEVDLVQYCESRGIPWTLFRPTLIYGCGQDKNITFIANFIRRFGFFPILGKGSGLRQPVHADDLAHACLQACKSVKTFNRAYNLCGGQTLSYYDMVEHIFHQQHKKTRIISIPPPIFHTASNIFSWMPKVSHLSHTMIMRMNENLCFDYSSARRDFGYQPRVFYDIGINLR